jgi:hypothetical protein
LNNLVRISRGSSKTNSDEKSLWRHDEGIQINFIVDETLYFSLTLDHENFIYYLYILILYTARYIMTKQIDVKAKSTIYDIFENSSSGRDHVSRLEAKDFDEAVIMVKDYYIKKEFHGDVEQDYVDEGLTYLTIFDQNENEEFGEDEDYETETLVYEIHVSDDQSDRSFKVISGHDEFITLDENGKTKTPFSQGKLLDQVKALDEKLIDLPLQVGRFT